MKVFKGPVSRLFKVKTPLGDVLEKMTGLKRDVLADAALKGALWIQKAAKGKILRIRNLAEVVSPNDLLTLNYDQKILSLPSLEDAECIFENKNYGVWVKASGVLPQGSQAGDHTSLLRLVEKKKKQEVFLVHRLDRETEGLMMIAYNSKAAAALSELFQKDQIKKTYEAIVLGEMKPGFKQTIEASLDDKEAVTHFKVLDTAKGKSRLLVNLETGRLHQIRRHLDHIGHPIMGDPKYGQGNKNRQGLQLLAVELSFLDPWDKKERSFSFNKSLTI